MALFCSLQEVGHPTAGETVAWISITIRAHRILTQKLLNKAPCTKLEVYKHMESFLCNKRNISFAFSQINCQSTPFHKNSGALGALYVTVISMITNDTATTQSPLTSPVPRSLTDPQLSCQKIQFQEHCCEKLPFSGFSFVAFAFLL